MIVCCSCSAADNTGKMVRGHQGSQFMMQVIDKVKEESFKRDGMPNLASARHALNTCGSDLGFIGPSPFMLGCPCPTCANIKRKTLMIRGKCWISFFDHRHSPLIFAQVALKKTMHLEPWTNKDPSLCGVCSRHLTFPLIIKQELTYESHALCT